MNELKIFENAEFGQIRTGTIDNQPWFVGKEVADILAYKDVSDALKRHVDDEDKLTWCFTDLGQSHSMTIINEYGLYSLVFNSKLESAKCFKHWVMSEVLPSIRKCDDYMTENTLEQALTSPDFLIQLATKLKEEKAARKAAEAQNGQDKPKVLFAEAVSDGETSILIEDLAKLLKQNGHETGRKRLFEKLKQKGYKKKILNLLELILIILGMIVGWNVLYHLSEILSAIFNYLFL